MHRGTRKDKHHLVAELIAPTVARGHGSDATAGSAATDGGNSTAANADAIAAAGLVAQQKQGALQTATAGIERQSQQQKLNVRGFDNIETFSGGED